MIIYPDVQRVVIDLIDQDGDVKSSITLWQGKYASQDAYPEQFFNLGNLRK